MPDQSSHNANLLDSRCAQTGLAAEELGQRRYEVMGRDYAGRAPVTLGDRRAHGGRIALAKRLPSRRSFTRGAWSSRSPAAVTLTARTRRRDTAN